MAGALGIEPKLTESKSVVLPLHNAPTIKQDTFFFTIRKVISVAVSILNLVPRTRIELVMAGYQPTVIPFNYKRNIGGRRRSRTPSHF